MVAINNPLGELQRRLLTRRKDSERITQIVEQGFISERFGDYAQQIIMLDHLADEAETFAKAKYQDKAIGSLVEMKFKLDSVAGVLMAAGKLETETIGNGLSVIKNPDFDNFEKYQELYDFARQRYDDTVNKCNKLLGAV